jgi:hypothetical protein
MSQVDEAVFQVKVGELEGNLVTILSKCRRGKTGKNCREQEDFFHNKSGVKLARLAHIETAL